jgi:hypothetical protein
MEVVEAGAKSVRKLSEERGIMELLKTAITPLFGGLIRNLRYCA